MTDDEIRKIWLENLQLMFPAFDEKKIRYFLIHRERFVEPLALFEFDGPDPTCEDTGEPAISIHDRANIPGTYQWRIGQPACIRIS